MCAIFGFVGREGQTPRLPVLREIIRANIVRGPHAFGFSWIDGRGRLRMYKQTGRLSDHVGVLAMARDARMLVGHLRWATHGDYNNNLNNHPHPADGGWIVHNGIVTNYASLVRSRRLSPVTACDSEVLGLMIESSAGTLLSRCARAARLSDGSLAMLGLWSRPATVITIRRGNPLHAAATPEGLYLGSMSGGLPGKAQQLPDNRASQIGYRGGNLITRYLSLPADSPRPAWNDQRSLYCGG